MQWHSCEGGPSGESFGCSGTAVRGVTSGESFAVQWRSCEGVLVGSHSGAVV